MVDCCCCVGIKVDVEVVEDQYLLGYEVIQWCFGGEQYVDQ